MSRGTRSPIPALLAALAMALASGAALAEPPCGTGGYVTAGQDERGLPANLLGARGVELQSPDRSRDRGPAGVRRSDAHGSHAPSRCRVTAVALPHPAPEDAALQALARAGRRSAPATAPPHFS